MNSRRSKPNDFDDGFNSDLTNCRMHSAMIGLLKRASEYNSRFLELEESGASMDGSLTRSSVLMNRLTNELRARDREIDTLRGVLRDNESALKHESQKSARSAILREQLAISVTNSICAGYLNVHMIDGPTPSLAERRFVSLNLVDLRIYDYTLSEISYRLPTSDYEIEILERPTDVEYTWKHKGNGGVFLFVVRGNRAVFSKWSHAMENIIQESTRRNSQGFGPLLPYSYPEGIFLIDDGSTITEVDSKT
jgi:hypothetical protein